MHGETAPRDAHPREILLGHGLRPRKAFGQNFLVAGADLDRVADAAELGPDDVALEVGTGLGHLTERLAARAGFVVSVEVDRGLHRVASERLRGLGNVALVCADFLESKHRIAPEVTEAVRDALSRRPGPLKAVSNLPYNISSPAIVNLLEWEPSTLPAGKLRVGSMWLMVQKEVAERLTAAPGTDQYGPLTVAVDYWATVQPIFRLPPQAFWPMPEVSSVLVAVARRPERVRTEGYEAFTKAVRRLFGGRRKTLGTLVRAGWGASAVDAVRDGLRLDLRARPQTLTTAQFEAIARTIGPPAEP